MNNQQNKTKTAPEKPESKPVTKEELTAFLKKIKFNTFTKVEDLYVAIKKVKTNINFENPQVIKLLAKSTLPILKGLAAKLAVLTKNRELEELLLKETDPLVLGELVKTENPKTAQTLSENKNLTPEMLDTLKETALHNLSSTAPVVANRILIAIIRNPNVLTSTLYSIIYNTRNYRVLRNILLSPRLGLRMLSAIISLNINNTSLIIYCLRSPLAKTEHFIYVISRTNDRRIIEFCSKQKDTAIIEFMASMNVGVELLIKNPFVTATALSTIVRQNIGSIELVQKVLLHRKVKNDSVLWEYVLKNSNDQKIFDLLASSGNPLFRLKIAQSFSQKLSDDVFRKLLKDEDKKVSDVLKNHKDENIRIRVSKLIEDSDYLLKKAVSSQSTKVKVAIAKRAKLDAEVELGLLKNQNKEVYLALARRTGDISTTTEEKLALTKDPEILIALSKRESIKSKTVLQLLASSRVEEVEMNVVKNPNNKSIHKMLIRETKSLKVANHVLRNAGVEERIALAQKDFEIPFLKTLVLEILKDPEVRVRAALLTNKVFLDQLWNVIHRKNEQTNTNPFYRAFSVVEADQNLLVRKRFNILISRLSEAKKAEIKRMFIRKEAV
jgi:hypothetical protein